MTFLKNQRAYQRWSANINRAQSTAIEAPASFPCFAYLVVASFGYEEEGAKYLYPFDVVKMLTMMKKIHLP